jgi:hypothetical protein
VAGEEDRSREARRQRRSTWPIVRVRLGDNSADDLSATTTPAERLAMMWPLAESAWRLAGRPLPDYDRSHAPTRLYRPGTRPPDDDDA